MENTNYLLLAILVFTLILFLYNFNKNESKVEKMSENKQNKEINICPLEENDFNTKMYIDKLTCSIQPLSRKQFNKNFFKFRDYTENNSSMTIDPVDKITNMYLDGDLGKINRESNIKIKDIYDSLTIQPILYGNECIRLPKYDNSNFSRFS